MKKIDMFYYGWRETDALYLTGVDKIQEIEFVEKISNSKIIVHYNNGLTFAYTCIFGTWGFATQLI